MDETFGAPTGKIGDSSISELKNGFASIADRSVDSMAQTDRIIPRQVSSGNTRGVTQRINNTDGSYITMGIIPDTDNEFGFAFFSASGEIIRKITAFTDYSYDLENDGKNVMQSNRLPDGTYGWAVAKEGYDVEDGY